MNAADLYVEVLEKRLAALDRLAEGLSESEDAVVAMDVDKVLQTIRYQETLCNEIRCFDLQLTALEEALSLALGIRLRWNAPQDLLPLLDGHSQRKLRLLLGGLENIQADIRRLNRIQAELLRRSRRTVNVLLNLTAHYTGAFVEGHDTARALAATVAAPGGY